ncbi:MAG TPA: hypothetical protein VFA12_20465 [Stellaceae bacterium]|nr:hypothetical protein [Stellaceae bacterium]
MAVEAIPKKAAKQPRDRGRVVLAYGEVTGHAHAIKTEGAVLLRTDDGEQYLDVAGDFSGPVGGVIVERDETSVTVTTERQGRVKFALADIDEVAGVVIPKRPWSPLVHEEHTAHAIPAGKYRRPAQREYSPAEIRNVAD